MLLAKRARERRRDAALLLVELMLGLTVIAMTILAIFTLFPMADRSVGQADRTAQANYIARSLMEERLAKPYAELPATTVPEVGAITVQHSQRRGQKLFTTFEYEVEVTQPEPTKALKRVTVTVGWQRGASQEAPKTVHLQCDKGSLW